MGLIRGFIINKRKALFVILLCAISLISCVDEKSKKDYYSTAPICSGLYVEMYIVYGSGAYGGDIKANYLTDSSKFSIFIGSFDDTKERYRYSCKGDSVFVEKFQLYKEQTITKKAYSISNLKKTGKME